MSISRLLCVATLVIWTATGCEGGGNCDPCDSDMDCDEGLTCAEFDRGERLCADADTDFCMVTNYY